MSKNKKISLLPLLLFTGWLASRAAAAPLPLPPGPVDTNLFNTNGLVISAEVRFLFHDLRTNLDQLEPFLQIINGETNRTNFTVTNTIGPFVAPTPLNSLNADERNGLPLIFALGAALENIQTDLDELLPRLSVIAGLPNNVTNSVSPTVQPNNFLPTQSNGIAVLTAPFFAQPTNPPVQPQSSATTPLF